MPLTAGARLGPYQIAGPLGAGGMGEVYKAFDTRLDRAVAIKILPSTDPARRQRFEREAKAIAALSHPNICTLHDVGHADGTDFLVVEYLEGETLADRLKRGPLAPAALVELAVQMADALDTAHAARIIHRDLKPLNVFVTKRGQAKVLDFGLAKIDRAGADASAIGSDSPTLGVDPQLTGPGSALGTVAYMSPEQARGDDTDHRTDIFSFGAMLYEMATGHPAFPGRTTAVVFDEILNKTSAPPRSLNAELPPDLERIIIKALEKDREQRHQSAADMRRDLQRVQSGVAIRPAPRPAGADDPGRSPRFWPRQGIRAAMVAAAGVLVVTGVLAWRAWVAPTSAGGPIDSVAVLPFANAGGTADADYLAEGISGTLTNNLTQVRGLRVIPRTLAARYKNQTVDPSQAGRDLNARAVVTGRVVQRGDQLVIEAELIDAVSVAQLWGDRFDRPLADVLSVQADISKAIADNLRLHLTREDEQGLTAGAPRDGVAYQLYLRGQFAAGRRTKEGYRQATQYFNQAIERDPSYALAYAGLADAAIWQAYWGYEPAADAYQRALTAAKRAIAIDEGSADAHALLGWISLYHDWNWSESEREYQRALALDPTSATIRQFYAESLGTRGRGDEAVAEVKRAAALDPLSGRIAVGVGFMLTNARRFDEAIEALNHAIELYPEQTLARLDLARAYRLAGQADLAIAESQRMIASGDPLGPAFLAAGYAAAGRKAEALALVTDMMRKARASHQGSFLVALVFAALDDRDQAVRWLNYAYEEHDTFLPWLRADPEFDNLHGDPGFEQLVRRIGIPTR